MSTKAMAFVATARPAEALVFYRDVLGLTFIEDSPFALVFDAFGTTLRVQKVKAVVVAPYTSFGLHVDDIAAHVTALTAKGLTFLRIGFFEQDALGIWTAPDGVSRVAWCNDPDQNIVSIAQY